MNREEEIERFRNEKLPEYIELAKMDAWVVERLQPPKNKIYKKCHKCKETKLSTEFYGRYQHVCKACKNKYQMKRYYNKRYQEECKEIS